ncbi:hypothetical protein AOR11_22000 [Vibrio alginolyticus]|nr:hypothetical protein AOR11_22000 [Vibrio alginolyticus]
MKVSVYIDELFKRALVAVKGSELTPSQKIAYWAEIGRFMETKYLGSLCLVQGQSNHKKT